MPYTTESATSTEQRLQRARSAAARVARLSTAEKNAILLGMEVALAEDEEKALAANRVDLSSVALPSSKCDRLLLNPERIAVMRRGLREIAELADPVHQTVAEWVRPNGLRIRKVRVPLGVVGVIYESRPNVTVDAAALALKAGNTVVLRGGREARHTNEQLVETLTRVRGLPEGSIELVDCRSRESVDQLLKARDFLDVLIPRGGPDLIAYVIQHATVPVIETGAGNCHIFVDETADFEMADRIVLNAKTQRPSVCNAVEKLLVHERVASEYIPRIVRRLRSCGVEVRGDEKTCQLASTQDVRLADSEDWASEYLDLVIAIRVVESLDEAIAHINRFSTKHSEAIVTGDEERAKNFLRYVDSAAVYWNASTRFSDGGEFGFGAEMGISTQKLHCRGPFALAELTSTKYEVLGCGQIRP